MEFELHKRLDSEVWNALNRVDVRWGDREFEQGRTTLFNVVILSAMAVEIFRKCVSSHCQALLTGVQRRMTNAVICKIIQTAVIKMNSLQTTLVHCSKKIEERRRHEETLSRYIQATQISQRLG